MFSFSVGTSFFFSFLFVELLQCLDLAHAIVLFVIAFVQSAIIQIFRGHRCRVNEVCCRHIVFVMMQYYASNGGYDRYHRCLLRKKTVVTVVFVGVVLCKAAILLNATSFMITPYEGIGLSAGQNFIDLSDSCDYSTCIYW